MTSKEVKTFGRLHKPSAADEFVTPIINEPPGSPAGETASEPVCGYCNGTGEICYSSTSYGSCPECVKRNAVPEPVPTEGSAERSKCADCRDYEANIREWIEQLGGNPDVQHISLELERLIDAIAPSAPEAAAAGYPNIGERYEARDGGILQPRLVDTVNDQIVYTHSDSEGAETVSLAQWNAIFAAPIAPAAEVLAKRIEDLRVVHQNTVRYWEHECAKLDAEKVAAEELIQALEKALTELVDSIEDAGGHDENGDVFDIRRACAVIARAEEYRKGAKNAGH